MKIQVKILKLNSMMNQKFSMTMTLEMKTKQAFHLEAGIIHFFLTAVLQIYIAQKKYSKTPICGTA